MTDFDYLCVTLATIVGLIYGAALLLAQNQFTRSRFAWLIGLCFIGGCLGTVLCKFLTTNLMQ